MAKPDAVADQLISVLDQQDQVRDESVGAQAPSGRYSSVRLTTLVDAVNNMLATIGAPTQVSPITIVPNKPTTLSVELMKALALIKSMITDYASEGEEDVRDISITDATDDASLALITRSILQLLGSKKFKKWLAQERTEPEEVGEQADITAEVEAPGQQVKNIDLMLLK